MLPDEALLAPGGVTGAIVSVGVSFARLLDMEAVAGFCEFSGSEVEGGADVVCPKVNTEEAGG
jgi:hypothetical protein